MTKKTKEAIKASAAIVIAVVAVIVLWIYPLNQAGKIVSRPDQDSTRVDPTEFNLAYDTLSFVTEDNIDLSGMVLRAAPLADDSVAVPDTAQGTVILVHGLFEDGSSQLPKAAALTAAGFRVIIYDQRAYGKSGGKYRSGGYYEGNDLEEVIYRLSLEDRLVHPLVVWGEDHGATAALRALDQDERIDYVIAQNSVVDGRDWQKRIRDHDRRTAPDLMLGLIWWWMKQKSGYEMSFDNTDISDAFGSAIVDKPDRLLNIACGSGDIPDNTYVAELKEMGGRWLVVSCSGQEPSPDEYRDKILPAVLEFIK